MTTDSTLTNEAPTLPFQDFWDWLIRHPNCILRAGSHDTVVYDDEDYHWHFAIEAPDTPLVQVMRGKRLVAEILITRERVAYVQGALGDAEGEHLFDLVVEDEADRSTAYFFVLSHGYDPPEAETPAGVHSIH